MVALKGKRSYTDAAKDIHEANDSYMDKVYQMYKQMAQDENWVLFLTAHFSSMAVSSAVNSSDKFIKAS